MGGTPIGPKNYEFYPEISIFGIWLKLKMDFYEKFIFELNCFWVIWTGNFSRFSHD